MKFEKENLSELTAVAKAYLAVRCAMRAQVSLTNSSFESVFKAWVNDTLNYIAGKTRLDLSRSFHGYVRPFADLPKFQMAAIGALSNSMRLVELAYNSESKYSDELCNSLTFSAFTQGLEALKGATWLPIGIEERYTEAVYSDFDKLIRLENGQPLDPKKTSPRESSVLGELWPILEKHQTQDPIDSLPLFSSLKEYKLLCQDTGYLDLKEKYGLSVSERPTLAGNEVVSYPAEAVIEGKSRKVLLNVSHKPFIYSHEDKSRLVAYQRFSNHNGIVDLFDYIFLPSGPDETSQLVTITDEFDKPLSQSPKEYFIQALKSVSKALDFLHGFDLFHIGVREDNIFGLGSNARLGTIGFPSHLQPYLSWQVAPEVEKNEKYDRTVDLYSLAVVFVSVFRGERVFKGKQSQIQRQKMSVSYIRKRLHQIGFSRAISNHVLTAIHPQRGRRTSESVCDWLNHFTTFDSPDTGNTRTFFRFLETLRAYTANEEPRF